MPVNIRTRESTENIPSARRVRDVDPTIHYLFPNANPLVLLSKRASKRSVFNSEFEWDEKDNATVKAAVEGAQTAADTAIEVEAGQGNAFFPSDLVLNTRTNELFRVTSVATDTLTVVRGVGSVAAAAMNDADTLLVVGTAYAEGAALGTERSHPEANKRNYSEIFRWPFGETGTEEASKNYHNIGRASLRKDAAKEHMLQIERAFIHGQKNKDAADTGKPIRYTGGFRYWVTTNVTDAGGTLTEPELETFLESLSAITGAGDAWTLMAAPKVVSILDQLAAGRLQLTPRDDTFGIAVQQYQTAHGTLHIVKHRLLADGFGDYALAVNTKNLGYAALRTRDTKLRVDVGTPGDDGWTDDYLTECGFQVQVERSHGILKNATG